MHERLETVLGIHFQNPRLLTLALTHRSYIYETAGEGQTSNERLEFLRRFHSGPGKCRISLSHLPQPCGRRANRCPRYPGAYRDVGKFCP